MTANLGGSPILLLVPDVSNVEQDLTAHLNAMNGISGWVKAFLAANLYPLENPPTWYSNFKTQFEAARTTIHDTWTTDLQPKLAADIPATFSTFNDMFQPFATDLEPIVAAAVANPKGQPTPEQVGNLNALLGVLLTHAQLQSKSVTALDAKVKPFLQEISDWQVKLQKTAHEASQAISDDDTKVEALKAQVTAIQEKLAADSTEADDQEVDYRTSLYSTIVTFTIGLAISGGEVALADIAVAVLSTGAAVVESVIATEEVIKDLEKLEQLQNSLNAEESQVAALQSVFSTVSTLAAKSQNIAQSMPNISRDWNRMCTLIETVQEFLNQTTLDVGKVSQLTHLAEAATAWQTLADFAGKAAAAELQYGAPIKLTTSSGQ